MIELYRLNIGLFGMHNISAYIEAIEVLLTDVRANSALLLGLSIERECVSVLCFDDDDGCGEFLYR